MDDDARAMEIFMEVQRGLPRQGPGNDDSTRRALTYCGDLPQQPSVLDIGCGPGMQTFVLAETLQANVTAVDLHAEYLAELEQHAAAAGLAGRVTAIWGDMNDLQLAPGSFDLIWAEGAAYIMGVANALRSWKPLLKPGGYIGLSELLWLTDDPPAEVKRFFDDAYPAMGDIRSNCRFFVDAGYDLVGHFTLPDNAWWDDYYTPLEAKLPALREKYHGDDEAMSYVQMTECEIEVRRKFGAAYGYEFFITQVAF